MIKNPTTKRLIIITGTPGVGKSTLANALSSQLKIPRLDLSRYYHQLSTTYDRKKRCYIIDRKKLAVLLREKLKASRRGLIVDSHTAHLLPRTMVKVGLVLTCSDLKILRRRLQKRKYSQKKIQENLQAEIFQICLEEARERGHTILAFDTSSGIPYQKIFRAVRKSL
ncbi:MAG: adenylate kinase family protein [Nanoarchaeota archaeon]